MRILDRYLIKRIAMSYFFILAIFVGLYLIIDIFSTLSDILKAKTPILVLFEYYLNTIPFILLKVSPIAILISTLFTFGELNKNNEILSIRASGTSILRISLPLIFFSIVISCFIFFLQEKIVIHSQKKVEDIKSRFIKRDLAHGSDEKNLAFTSDDMIFFAEKFSPKNKVLENVIIFTEDNNRIIIKKAICKKIIYKNQEWIGQDIVEYDLDKTGKMINFPNSWQSKKIQLKEKPHELILKRSIFSSFYSLKHLKTEIVRLKKVQSARLLDNLTIDYYQKIADPFSHLFLVIGILPIALEIKKRKAGLSSFGIGFIFGFSYYIISSFSIALGKTGFILPFLSPLVTPLFFISFGITGLILIR